MVVTGQASKRTQAVNIFPLGLGFGTRLGMFTKVSTRSYLEMSCIGSNLNRYSPLSILCSSLLLCCLSESGPPNRMLWMSWSMWHVYHIWLIPGAAAFRSLTPWCFELHWPPPSLSLDGNRRETFFLQCKEPKTLNRSAKI